VVTEEMGDIGWEFDAHTGTLSISSSSGVAPAQMQAVLRGVTFINTSANADLSPRTLTIKAYDGFVDSNTVTGTVTLALPPPTPTPPSTVVDGVTVDVTPGTGPDGEAVQTVTVPIVQPGRTDTVGGDTLADIPLVKDGSSNPLLTAQVPVGYGLTVSGPSAPQTAGTSLDNLLQQIKLHTLAGSQDQTMLTGGSSSFLEILPPAQRLLVQTVAPVGNGGASPLVISGPPASDTKTALVIDTTAIVNSIIQLVNVDFAAVIGSTTIINNSPGGTIIGDGGSQTLVLTSFVSHIVDGGSGHDKITYDLSSKGSAVIATKSGWTLKTIQGISTLVSEGATTVAATETGSDLIKNVETLKFTDKEISLPDHIVAVQVGAVLREGPLEGSGGAAAASLTSQLATLGSEGVVKALVQLADATSSVATLAYQFFTGHTPTADGMDYLVSSTGPNANSLNSAYYQSFSLENRYINFAVNLGKFGEGAAGFQAKYGALSLFDATRAAYTTIFGGAPSDDKLHSLLDATFTVANTTFTRAQYFAALGQDGANGIGTKAAMVGWLLGEAAKADVGTYALANNALLTDVALNDAPLGVGLIGTYDKPEFAYHG
jgi:hypothetical protein